MSNEQTSLNKWDRLSKVVPNEQKSLNKWDRLMTAITFAEAGEPKTAREILEKTKRKQKQPEKQEIKRPDLRA